MRLADATPGAEIPAYVPPQGEVKLSVKAMRGERCRLRPESSSCGSSRRRAQRRRNRVDATVAVDDRNRLARLEMPSAQPARSSATTSPAFGARRSRRPGTRPTSDVTIPATGFNIAGTMTMPPGQGRLRHPTVVLVGRIGSGRPGRDRRRHPDTSSQLAGALAERGFMVLRYDKRGVGQSGGRIETVTLQDYADDVVGDRQVAGQTR